ncbi:alpha/beta hydrolase family esterase [Albidovulum sp.]|uniref:alpha/beta hydrolase family esterase n=1 Tax=Albidovulum sp. TaxID=1872424 RepID=UPI001DFCF1AA|nr:hypothetical protein [Paracoccaceae bacterium]MCC0045903.1 hypothetical protein [Defluviimonas sp.]HPE24013.1 PHB depolymerase family esterase [Albidovulum sp.]MCB2119623.1 hypothetical protein [Paracoccaceae bacterium]MCB2121711.1 hypothetical protein [Paracoccaceae bacterium]
MIRRAFLILAMLAAPLAARADLSRHDLVQDGLQRSYRLFVPDGIARFAGPRPVVLVLHGGGGSSREVRLSTRRRFDELAEAHGFLVVYPDAVGRIWDTGAGMISSRLQPRRDDAAFLERVIAEVAARHPVDKARVFATGVSRGGMQAYALACGNPGLIRAIAPVAMPLPEASLRACRRGAAFGFLLIHGTADPIVPYDGGPITLGRRERDTVLSAPETYAVFQRRNGCKASVEGAPAGSVRRFNARGCRAPTAFLSVGGGGHGWPGGRKMIPGGRAGPINRDISSPDEIWAFFSRF